MPAAPYRFGVWWYGLMALGRAWASACSPTAGRSATDILVHPLVMFFILVGARAAGAARRCWRGRCPEVISDRALIAGCVVGLAAFLAGNFVGAHVLPLR